MSEDLRVKIDADVANNFENEKDIKISSEKNSFQLYWAGKNEAIKKSCQDCKDRAIEPQQQESKD